jgi:hypothetical protein
MYEQLVALNAGFEEVRRALRKLRSLGSFDSAERAHLSALSEEARAASNSYLASVIETLETEHAGKFYRHRLDRERKQESG